MIIIWICAIWLNSIFTIIYCIIYIWQLLKKKNNFLNIEFKIWDLKWDLCPPLVQVSEDMSVVCLYLSPPPLIMTLFSEVTLRYNNGLFDTTTTQKDDS